MGNLIFKGIQQVFASGFTADNATNGVLYFVRNAATGDADIYFGKKHYGSLNATQIKGLQESINKNAGDIITIKARPDKSGRAPGKILFLRQFRKHQGHPSSGHTVLSTLLFHPLLHR